MNENHTTAQRSRTWQIWERTDNPPPFQMQERDISIIQEVFRHRYLTVSHIYALFGGSRERLGLRCRLLWQHGYLERPKALRPTRILTEEIVYALGKKGAQLLEHQHPELRIAALDWAETPKKQNTWPYVDHQLGVATFMICARLAAQRRGITLHWDGHFNRNAQRITVPGTKTRFMPDAYFTLEVPGKGVAHHFLELDRGNVSLQRMQQRYSYYFDYWKTGTTSGRTFKHFRVLTVTKDPDYVHSLRRVALPIGRNGQHQATWKALMFTHAETFTLENPERTLSPIWLYADENEFCSLV
jgi:hypothetical protein